MSTQKAPPGYKWIYGLIDTGEGGCRIHYIGQTVDPLMRACNHRTGGRGFAKVSNPKLLRWLQRVEKRAKYGDYARCLLLELAPKSEILKRERWWVEFLSSLGHPLKNYDLNPRRKEDKRQPAFFAAPHAGASYGYFYDEDEG
jgi:hypothetical protein